MRWILLVIGLAVSGVGVPMAQADEDADRLVGGVISGLLGGPQQPADAAYLAKERERLASLLHSGDYATSRQGEPVDAVILGVPLTRTEHVYTAKPIPPSQTSGTFDR